MNSTIADRIRKFLDTARELRERLRDKLPPGERAGLRSEAARLAGEPGLRELLADPAGVELADELADFVRDEAEGEPIPGEAPAVEAGLAGLGALLPEGRSEADRAVAARARLQGEWLGEVVGAPGAFPPPAAQRSWARPAALGALALGAVLLPLMLELGRPGRPPRLVGPATGSWFGAAAAPTPGAAGAEDDPAGLYARGRAREAGRDFTGAAEFYRRAAAKGHPAATNNLGVLYFERLGRREEGLALVRKAAELGSTAGMMNLAWSLDEGSGVAADPVGATGWYRRAAETGDPEAMFRMGWRAGQGLGMAADPGAAADWYRRGAALGHPGCELDWAECLEAGRGVAADPAGAVDWVQKSADRGYADAEFALGQRYEAGAGVPRSLAGALEWYQKAARQGHIFAGERIEALEAAGTLKVPGSP